MVNSEDFSKRLQKILDYFDISAAAFADAIDVGRSSISHILSGRNKPSLDFVLKIVQAYPEVELYWLLNGKGQFPKSAEKEIEKEQEKSQAPSLSSNSREEAVTPAPQRQEFPIMKDSQGRTIQKIIILYTDGSFDAYEN